MNISYTDSTIAHNINDDPITNDSCGIYNCNPEPVKRPHSIKIG